jgi:hypothetical protein
MRPDEWIRGDAEDTFGSRFFELSIPRQTLDMGKVDIARERDKIDEKFAPKWNLT